MTADRWGRRASAMLAIAAALPLLAAATVPTSTVPAPDERTALRQARADAARAQARAEALESQANDARGEAERLASERAALAARLDKAVADVRAAEARVALIAGQQREREAQLDGARAPLLRLNAALATLARRPAALAMVQRGSLADIVHVRALLAGLAPEIERRTSALRADIEEGRRLGEAVALAIRALGDSRRDLGRRREELALSEGAVLRRAGMASAEAAEERERALAMAETARDIVERLDRLDAADAVADRLSVLDGPAPRSGGGGPVSRPPAYRLPAQGQLVAGTGEATDPGYRARGLALAVAPGAEVRAPAGGIVRYAGDYRGYGAILIIDHGGGWTSLVTGMATLAVAKDARVTAGALIGRAPDAADLAPGAQPQLLVELRRRDRVMDVAAFL